LTSAEFGYLLLPGMPGSLFHLFDQDLTLFFRLFSQGLSFLFELFIERLNLLLCLFCQSLGTFFCLFGCRLSLFSQRLQLKGRLDVVLFEGISGLSVLFNALAIHRQGLGCCF